MHPNTSKSRLLGAISGLARMDPSQCFDLLAWCESADSIPTDDVAVLGFMGDWLHDMPSERMDGTSVEQER